MLSIVLQDPIFKQLRDFIYERSGIYIPDTKKYLLENRLIKRIQERKLNSYEDYLYLIRNGSNAEELAKLFDAVTTNETFFFREPQQLDVFIDIIVPKILEKKSSVGKHSLSTLRIWSAACSTGEEPYNISMLLMEKMPSVRAEILASDISEGVLESAKRAVYSSYSIRNVPELYLKKYFKNNGQFSELISSVKSNVKFMNINLVDEKKMKTIKNTDVIFCRNVLIYFDDRAKQKVVSHLYDSLNPEGFLFVGSSESLHNVTRAFKPVVINKVIVYQKI